MEVLTLGSTTRNMEYYLIPIVLAILFLFTGLESEYLVVNALGMVFSLGFGLTGVIGILDSFKE